MSTLAMETHHRKDSLTHETINSLSCIYIIAEHLFICSKAYLFLALVALSHFSVLFFPSFASSFYAYSFPVSDQNTCLRFKRPKGLLCLHHTVLKLIKCIVDFLIDSIWLNLLNIFCKSTSVGQLLGPSVAMLVWQP